MVNHDKFAKESPEIYDGEVDVAVPSYFCDREYEIQSLADFMDDDKEAEELIMPEPLMESVLELAKKRKLHRILYRSGVWCVTDYGIECLSSPYHFKKSRVHESDWIEHMSEKVWVNIVDFTDALNMAREVWPQD